LKSLASSLTDNHALSTLLLCGKFEVIHGVDSTVFNFGGFFLWGGICGHGLVWGNKCDYFEISIELSSVNENSGLFKRYPILNKKEKREKEATICGISLT
jgi:hypothetical protein